MEFVKDALRSHILQDCILANSLVVEKSGFLNRLQRLKLPSVVTTLFLFQWIQKELHSFEDVVWHVSWSVSGQFLAVSGGDNKGNKEIYVTYNSTLVVS